MKVIYLPILHDNYVWLLVNEASDKVVAVDPGDSDLLDNFLLKERLSLTDILITHHHNDHTGGILALSSKHAIKVYGPEIEHIIGVTDNIIDNQEIYIECLNISFKILSVPGHTLGHIAYYNAQHGILFCGDTLFSAGCGRVFEGTYEQLYASLQRLNSLPEDTLIYCTHEYTLNNLKFAAIIEPDNIAIQEKISSVLKCLAAGKPSLPTTLRDERKINPFLRCNKKSVIDSVQNLAHVKFDNEIQTFTYLRKLKDNF